MSFPFFFYPNNSVRLSSTAIRTYFISSLSLIVVLKKKKDPICGVTEAVETEHVSAYFTSFPQKKKNVFFFICQANTSFLFSLCYCLLFFFSCAFPLPSFFFFVFIHRLSYCRHGGSSHSARANRREKKTCPFCPIKKENEKLGLLCPRFCLIVDHLLAV